MNKLLYLLFIPALLLSVELKDTTLKYRISYGFFGELSEAEIKLIVIGNRYKIEANAYPIGFTSSVLDDRKDTFLSSGQIKDMKLVPDEFRNFSNSDTRISKKIYKFNHRNKSVLYSREKSKKKDYWKLRKKSKKNPFYSQNDIFSLFFNIIDEVENLPKGEKNRFIAVGANSKTGALDIVIPLEDEKREIRELLDADKNDQILKVYINRKILSSSSGELYLALDSKGYCNSAILKDVLLFGDLEIDRVK